MTIIESQKKCLILLLTFLFFWYIPPSLSYSHENNSSGLVKLRLLETTDLHASLVNYNYYQGKQDNKIGLIKTAALIKQARNEVPNSLLFDVGDHLQGNPLGGYMAWVKGVSKKNIHPVYRSFNHLNYDAITVGNHEFNYGLEFLTKSLKGANMPVVNANVYNADGSKPYFKPFVILKRRVIDENGKEQLLRIGIIGVLPPQIMHWDKVRLEGKVKAISMVEAVKKSIPQMKKSGADLIIILAHTGISSNPYAPNIENAAYYLVQIPQVDAVLTGHSHAVFPGPVFKGLPHADLVNGTVFGKPVVMSGAYGNRLGIIDLNLKKTAGKWAVISSYSTTRPIADEDGTPLAKSEKSLYNIIKSEHLETIDYMKKLGI